MANHTATHLLQAALRQVLGEHVRQTGSLVDSERLRFDFTHMKKMDERELARAEEIVNENIRKSVPVKKEMKGLDEAKREGAIALFDEKYDKQVRVVSVAGISKELCGGTHVDNTGDIGLFKIMGESSIASGVRRIEAVTGEAARKWLEEEARSRDLKLKARKEKEEKEALLRKRCDEALSKADLYIGASGGAGAGGTKIICEIIEGADMEILRKLADRIKAKVKSAVIVLAAKEPEKASFVVAAAGGAAGCVDASALAKELAGALNGSAGGRPDFAQGGGRNPSALGEALEKIRVKVEAKVKERTR
jgi:alanyl-tRNA synthetase